MTGAQPPARLAQEPPQVVAYPLSNGQGLLQRPTQVAGLQRCPAYFSDTLSCVPDRLFTVSEPEPMPSRAVSACESPVDSIVEVREMGMREMRERMEGQKLLREEVQ